LTTRLLAEILLFLIAVPRLRSQSEQIAKLHGTVRYEKILTDSGKLDIDHPLLVPAAGVTVEIVEVVPIGDDRVLASDTTDNNGNFSVRVPLQGTINIKIRALAENGNAQVVDVDSGKEYAVATDDFTVKPQDDVERNVTATDHASDHDRGSGPFNIVAVISKANAFLHIVAPGLVIPPVVIRWSTTYDGDTYFDATTNPPQAFINGVREEDSDEFDDSVIIHEYGHFIAAKFSRDDSPGGAHSLGEKKDPRLAWSEGWANFFSSSVRNDPKYVDTLDVNGMRSFSFSLNVDVWRNESPGFWSEHTVGSSLWGIFAKPAVSGPQAHLGFGFEPIWRLLSGPIRSERYVNLLEFADDFCSRPAKDCAKLIPVLANHDILYKPGQKPPVSNPYPRPLQIGLPQTGVLDSSSRQVNKLEAQDVYSFSESENSNVKITLTVTSSPTPAHSSMGIYLFDDSGSQLGSSISKGVNQSAEIQTLVQKGKYFVEVRSWASSAGSQFNRGQYKIVLAATTANGATH
jgi:hypothetical protein